MIGNDIVQIMIFFAALLLLAKPLGVYMARVYEGQPSGLDRLLGPVERLFYRICGINADEEMGWKKYAGAVLIFSAAGFFFLYVLQRLQGMLPLNPQKLPAVPAGLAFNTAVSFVTANSSTSFGKSPDVRFICSARSSSTTLTTNSPVASTLRSVSFLAPSRGEHENAIVGGSYPTLDAYLSVAERGEPSGSPTGGTACGREPSHHALPGTLTRSRDAQTRRSSPAGTRRLTAASSSADRDGATRDVRPEARRGPETERSPRCIPSRQPRGVRADPGRLGPPCPGPIVSNQTHGRPLR